MGGPECAASGRPFALASKALRLTGGLGDARAELEKAWPPLVLMDQDEFIAMLTENTISSSRSSRRWCR